MTQDLKTIDKKSSVMVAEAEKFEVANQLNYDAAAHFLKNCDLFKKKIELFFKPTIENFKRAKAEADKGRKQEIDRMTDHTAPVTEAISIVRSKCKQFENEQEEIRLKKEQEERDRAEKEAEEKRKELAERAKVAKEWDDKEEAKELEEQIEEVEVEEREVAPTIAKSTNLGIRRSWKWRVTDKAIIPREFLLINEVALNKFARENEDNKFVNGVEFYYE